MLIKFQGKELTPFNLHRTKVAYLLSRSLFTNFSQSYSKHHILNHFIPTNFNILRLNHIVYDKISKQLKRKLDLSSIMCMCLTLGRDNPREAGSEVGLNFRIILYQHMITGLN